jgi:cytochrome c-type biogenesis protein CcsB
MLFETLFPNLIFALLFCTVVLFFWSPQILVPSQSSNTLFFGFSPFYLPDVGVFLSNILLSIFLLYRWFESGHPPMSNLYESLLFLTWGFLVFYLVGKTSLSKGQNTESEILNSTNSLVQPTSNFGFQRTLGMILLSTALFTYTFATWRLPSEMQTVTPLVPALQSNWLLMHVSIMLLSYAALLGGSLISITYLVLDFVSERSKNSSIDPVLSQLNESENKKAGGAIPELLINLDNLSYRSLAFAFPMLTLGIISGAVWANEAWGSYWSWDPKETWALITWFIFAIYLHVRINKGWIGQKAALVATLGFFMVWICYLGVNLLGKGLHSYGFWES